MSDHDHDPKQDSHEHHDERGPDVILPGTESESSAATEQEAGLITGRAASVRFNRDQSRAVSNNRARMDAANQSLADALRITYRFLQVGMFVLVMLFVFSGMQRINEGERGISVFLGKTSSTNLEPGAHITAPYPMGEMIRVGEGAVEIALARDFMPSRPGVTSEDELLNADISVFNSNARLNPASDSMMLTADQNIAHAQFRVNYHRSDHLSYVENVLPELERPLITLQVRRAVVHTIAETTIDDLLKSSAEAIGAQIREKAQRSLDKLDSGITIDRVVLVRKNGPLFILDKFASVQSAAQSAGEERENALLNRDRMLNEVAGRASPVLIDMINEYERLIELSENDEAEALLAQIDTVMEGGEVNWKGQSTRSLVSGEVSEILQTARSEASTRVSQAIADLEQFKAKQAQYDANPMLMVARDWSTAMAEFLNKDFVVTMYLPEGRDAELLINPDPEIERERDRLRRREDAARNMLQRRQDAEEQFYRTRRGIQPTDEP